MTAALLAPRHAAAQKDDSPIIAVVIERGARTRTWVTPSATANPRVQIWCSHALDGEKRYNVLTMRDLMALPPIT